VHGTGRVTPAAAPQEGRADRRAVALEEEGTQPSGERSHCPSAALAGWPKYAPPQGGIQGVAGWTLSAPLALVSGAGTDVLSTDRRGRNRLSAVTKARIFDTMFSAIGSGAEG
jgi:hypothetical protein